MAETDTDKTEDPTSKKLEEAFKKGDVAKSQEVNTWFLLAGGTLAIFMFGGYSAGQLAEIFRNVLAGAHLTGAEGFSYVRLGSNLMWQILIVVSPLIGILMLAALAGNYVQHGFIWTTDQLLPKLSRISLTSGAKRLFSKQAVLQLIKGLAKMAIVGIVIFSVAYPERDRVMVLVSGDVTQLMPLTLTLMLRLLVGVCAVMAVIAGLDWLWTRHTWYEKHRMTLHEIREEHKESEGDPTIKAKLRQIRRMRMRKRMMTEVPKATVVITNPTHYAIALKYESGMNAPRCVAKGMDALALRIRALAEEHRVPIVENPLLARALHKSIEIDEEVPAEHYKAVAEVIGYVMRLRRSVRMN
jgi:flagellar biosynthetic protein FlhB